MPEAQAPSSWDHQKMSPDVAQYLLGAIRSWLKTLALRDHVNHSLNPNTEGSALWFSTCGAVPGNDGWSPIIRIRLCVSGHPHSNISWHCGNSSVFSRKTKKPLVSSLVDTEAHWRRRYDSGIMIRFALICYIERNRAFHIYQLILASIFEVLKGKLQW